MMELVPAEQTETKNIYDDEGRLIQSVTTVSLPDVPEEHIPRRGSDVETWLRAHRDAWEEGDPVWHALDDLLDTYRLHSDTGVMLSQPVTEGGEI